MGTRESGKVRDLDYTRGASSDEIRSEIDRTLTRMDHTLDELTEKLRPGHVIDDVVGYIRERASDFVLSREEAEEPPEEEELFEEPAEPVAPAGGQPVNWRRALGPAAFVLAGMAWMVFEEERAKRRRRTRVAVRKPVEPQARPRGERRLWERLGRFGSSRRRRNVDPYPEAQYGSSSGRKRKEV